MKTPRVRAVCIAIFLAFLPIQAQESSLLPQTLRDLEHEISAFMSQYDVPGLSVAVVNNGVLAWANGYGMSDVENFVPAKAGTVYRLASISKTITATAAMQLYERGKLDLDAPIQKYCPLFPPKTAPITTRQLLGHYSGIRHYQGDEMSSTRHYKATAEALQIFANDPLVEPPGGAFRYTTYGYTVLGCVLEGASGQKFIDLVQQNIFSPARMEHTQADDINKIIYNRAQGYQKSQSGAVLNSELADTSYKIPGGGLVSTAEDLARFAIALENDALMRHATRELMWTPDRKVPGSDVHYALGWFVGQEFGTRVVRHSGSQQRVSTALALAPDKKTAVVVLANLEEVPAMNLARKLLGMVSGSK